MSEWSRRDGGLSRRHAVRLGDPRWRTNLTFPNVAWRAALQKPFDGSWRGCDGWLMQDETTTDREDSKRPAEAVQLS